MDSGVGLESWLAIPIIIDRAGGSADILSTETLDELCEKPHLLHPPREWLLVQDENRADQQRTITVMNSGCTVTDKTEPKNEWQCWYIFAVKSRSNGNQETFR